MWDYYTATILWCLWCLRVNDDVKISIFFILKDTNRYHSVVYNQPLCDQRGSKIKTKCKGEPTLILFRTGSYTIMGCKSINQVKEYRMFIINLLNHFVK